MSEEFFWHITDKGVGNSTKWFCFVKTVRSYSVHHRRFLAAGKLYAMDEEKQMLSCDESCIFRREMRLKNSSKKLDEL